MKIESAKATDFAELMDHLLLSFRTGNAEHARFEVILPDLYQPTDESVGQHLVCRDGGRIVSAVGVFPMHVRLAGADVVMGGIGGVSTAPSHRGHGLMTKLMTVARQRMADEGYPFSWLGGSRSRYAHFGFETAGTVLRVCMSKRNGQRLSCQGWRIRELDPKKDDLSPVLRAKAGLQFTGLADEPTLRLKLLRPNCRVWLAEKNGETSYAVSRYAEGKPGDALLADWGGAASGVAAILAHFFTLRDSCVVDVPACRTPYHEVFFECAEWWLVTPSGRVALLDLRRTLEHLLPFLATRSAGVSGRARLAMEDEFGPQEITLVADNGIHLSADASVPELRVDSRRMSALLFGPVRPSLLLDLPGSLTWLDALLPLPLWVPSLWGV